METNTKKCPFCAEEIRSEAIKCKHCGEMLVEKVNNENKHDANRLKMSTLFSAGLLVSYFLPWYTISVFNFNGYEIPIYIDKLISLKNIVDIDIYILKVSYVLFLIPICSVFNIVKGIANVKGGYLLNEFAIGLLCTCIFYLILNYTDVDYTMNLSIGYYLTLLFSALGFLSSSRLIKSDFYKNIKTTKDHE